MKVMTLGKKYGINCGALGNIFGNTLRTLLEQKNSKNHILPPKEKKMAILRGAC
jgi:hypothetical protein